VCARDSIAIAVFVSVYGVIGYSVQQRRPEFGVRRALGAGPREILQLILGECLGLTGVGIALCFALTLLAGLGMQSLLFDVSPPSCRGDHAATQRLVRSRSLTAPVRQERCETRTPPRTLVAHF
jgi:putative ABC transport system permease protein